MTFIEVGLQVTMADRFQHLYGNDLVELPGDISIIGQLEVNFSLEALGGDSFPGIYQLLLRDRYGADLAAIIFSGVDGKSSPSASDLEHVISGVDLHLLAETVILLSLRGLDVLIGRAKIRRGVGHTRVQEQLEEMVAEVIVL